MLSFIKPLSATEPWLGSTSCHICIGGLTQLWLLRSSKMIVRRDAAKRTYSDHRRGEKKWTASSLREWIWCLDVPTQYKLANMLPFGAISISFLWNSSPPGGCHRFNGSGWCKRCNELSAYLRNPTNLQLCQTSQLQHCDKRNRQIVLWTLNQLQITVCWIKGVAEWPCPAMSTKNRSQNMAHVGDLFSLSYGNATWSHCIGQMEPWPATMGKIRSQQISKWNSFLVSTHPKKRDPILCE